MKTKRIQTTLKKQNLQISLINGLDMRSQKQKTKNHSAFFSLNDQNYDTCTGKGNNELDLQSEVWFYMLDVHNPLSLRCKDSEDKSKVKKRILEVGKGKERAIRGSFTE